MDLDDLLNGLRNFNDLFDSLDHWNWLLNDDLNDLGNVLDVVDNLSGVSVLNGLDDLLLDYLDFDNLRNGYHFFNHLFDDLFNLDNSLDDFFNGNDLLLDDLDFLNLRNSVVHNLLDN